MGKQIAAFKFTRTGRPCSFDTDVFKSFIKRGVWYSFSQFYRQLKITWAKQLLLETDKTIAQISEDLGFVEDSYFVRIFKQETGETPLNTVKERTEHKTTTPRSRCFCTLAVANATSAKGALYLSCDKVILLNMNW